MDLLEKFLFEPHILHHSLNHQICRLQSLESEFIIFYGTVYFIREVNFKQVTPTHLPFGQLKLFIESSELSGCVRYVPIYIFTKLQLKTNLNRCKLGGIYVPKTNRRDFPF